MNPSNTPIDPRIRLAITQWPRDAPRGAVSTFCEEHEISRNTFYKIRKRALTDGPAAALEPRSRQPKHSPNRLDEAVLKHALHVRSALERSGLDHGPISVHEKMVRLGMEAPSTAALSRWFRIVGVARAEPKKRPRAAFRRFVYPAPNCCWQLDGTEYVLTGGRRCVIFQLLDDHSRYAVASLAAWTENADDALKVVQIGIARHGVPQKLLTDNGAALNPSRHSGIGKLTAYVTSLGVEAITGKPFKPTTQGKNERFHQTLFRFLDAQPLADNLEELQAQIDLFDRIYNEERPHQGLPGRVTPAQAWAATPKATPPRPPGQRPASLEPSEEPVRQKLREELRATTVRSTGVARVRGIQFNISRVLVGETVYFVETEATIMFFDCFGDLLIEFPWPPAGTKYVGNGQPRGGQKGQRRLSPMS